MSVSRRGLFGWLAVAPVAMVTPAVAKPALTVNPMGKFRDAQMMANYWRSLETEIVALAPRAPYVLGDVVTFAGIPGKWEVARTVRSS